MRNMKRVLFSIAFLGFAAAAFAQEAPAPVDDARERAQMAEKIGKLEAEIQNLRDESHAAVEGVQDRLDDSNLHLNRVLLIFAAAALLILLLSAHNIRLRQRAAGQKIDESIRESQTLARDLRRHLAAPEMQHLRVSQFLRELMRRLRDNASSGLSESQSRMVREAASDMHIPAALHFMAIALRDEHNNEWEKAVPSLNRLREMDPDDPDILLHLAHVHGKLSESSPDPKVRALNRRLAHQYYTRFAMALRTMEVEDAPIPIRRTYIQIPQTPSPAAPPKPLEFPEPKIRSQAPVAPPPTIEPVPEIPPARPTPPVQAAPTPAPAPTSPAPQKVPQRGSLRPPDPLVRSATPFLSKPAPLPSTPPTPPARPAPPAPTPSAPAAKPAPTPPPAPVVAKQTPAAKPAPVAKPAPAAKQTPAAKPTPVAKPTSPAQAAPETGMITVPSDAPQSRRFHPRISFDTAAVLEKSAAALKRAKPAAMRMKDGIGKLTSALVPKDEILPDLPVPEVSGIPPEAVGPEALMWRAIRTGDQAMAQALPARTFRERHRKIDQAIGLYAEAQSHKTNDVLYFNWGLALLGKALNTPDKKRAVFMNAAVDKFMAGNVVRPGAFDFHLASLYALMGDGDNCRKWLQSCADNDSLSVAALQAPDFDAVRTKPWFRDFASK